MKMVTVQALHDNKIPKVNERDGLSLYCCRKDDNTYNDTFEMRGVVVDSEKNTVVLKGLPYCTEVILGTKEYDEIKDNIDLKTSNIYQSYEGTVIRVFYYNGKWHTSTNKRINAFESKWAAKETTFGDSFANSMRHYFSYDVLKEDQCPIDINDVEYLNLVYEKFFNKKNNYMFLLKPIEEERIVALTENNQANRIIHLCTIDSETQEEIDEPFDIPRSENLDLKEWSDVDTVVSKCDPWVTQGILIITKCGKHYKIYNPEYYTMFNLRNNMPSIRRCYLDQRMSEKSFNLFTRMYPFFDYKKVESDIYDTCNYLGELYWTTYVNKVPLPEDISPAYKNALAKIHRYYVITRVPIKQDMIDYILSEKMGILNAAMKKHIWETNQDILDIQSKMEQVENLKRN